MASERTIPFLPCRLLNEVLPFYEALEFDVTYRQARPNPYAVVRLNDIELHFCEPPDFSPERSGRPIGDRGAAGSAGGSTGAGGAGSVGGWPVVEVLLTFAPSSLATARTYASTLATFFGSWAGGLEPLSLWLAETGEPMSHLFVASATVTILAEHDPGSKRRACPTGKDSPPAESLGSNPALRKDRGPREEEESGDTEARRRRVPAGTAAAVEQRRDRLAQVVGDD